MIGVMTGGCQCGAVRYRVSGPRPPVYCCHCRECQKQSASAFGMSLPLSTDAIAIDGTCESWTRPTDLGGRTRCFFCAQCGSRVYHQSEATPDRLTLKAGSLDDGSWLTPAAHIWVSRRQPWVVIDPAIPQHPTQPDDLAAWRGAGPGEME